MDSITICVNYSDFLEITLPRNLRFFDRCVIVTDTKDVKTAEVCSQYPNANVQCVKTDLFYSNNAPFCKGKGLNYGIQCLKPQGWVAIWDADILIDNRFSDYLLEIDQWDKQSIHGPLYKFHVQKNETGSNLHWGGKACAGFLQVFHQSAFKGHPEKSQDCSEDDIQFSQTFKSVKYLDTKCFHLGPTSDDGKPNVNWQGRKSPPFKMTAEDADKLLLTSNDPYKLFSLV